MTYTVSDIHGCYDKYIKLLKKIDLGSDDTLYVLGDVIDRALMDSKLCWIWLRGPMWSA